MDNYYAGSGRTKATKMVHAFDHNPVDFHSRTLCDKASWYWFRVVAGSDTVTCKECLKKMQLKPLP